MSRTDDANNIAQLVLTGGPIEVSDVRARLMIASEKRMREAINTALRLGTVRRASRRQDSMLVRR